MKRIMIMSAILAMVVAGGWYTVQAGPMGIGCRGPQAEGGGYGCRSQRGWEDGHMGRFSRMAGELGLSESQRQEIEAIRTAQREKDAPLREKIFAGKQKLWDASRDSNTGDTALEDLAAEQASLMSEMMVSRVRVQNQIFAVLTSEQQEQAKKLQGDRGFGPGAGCGGPGCGPCGDGPAELPRL